MTRVQTAPIGPGAMLAGKYRVERVLGEGGMGIVVAARHTQLDQRVAVKFMRAEALGQGDGIDRFLREARAAARLEGDHVVRVMDVGTLDDGAPYIVMEYLDGQDLGSLLAERGKLTPAEAGQYVLEACEAMAEAHAQGIVHRDLKPENLFLVRRPGKKALIKVLDFGISKLLETSDQLSSTRTSVMMGSPAYMSPEQMQSPKYVDGRTDIWSLGVILYQLSSGRLPYMAESVLMLSALVLTQDYPRLETVAPGIPPAFAAVVHRCLSRDLAKRFQTADELAEALAASIAGLPMPAVRLESPAWKTPPAGIARVTPAPTGNDHTMPAGSGTPVAVPGTPMPMLITPSGPVPLTNQGPVPIQITPVPATGPVTVVAARRGWVVPVAAAGAVILGIVAYVVVRSSSRTPPAPTTTAPATDVVTSPPPVAPPAADQPTTHPGATVDPPPVEPPAVAPPTTDPPPEVTEGKPPDKTPRKPPKRPKRPKERPDDDPFGTLQ